MPQGYFQQCLMFCPLGLLSLKDPHRSREAKVSNIARKYFQKVNMICIIHILLTLFISCGFNHLVTHLYDLSTTLRASVLHTHYHADLSDVMHNATEGAR